MIEVTRLKGDLDTLGKLTIYLVTPRHKLRDQRNAVAYIMGDMRLGKFLLLV